MSETPENPNALLEEIRGGAQRTFDAPELCHLLLQILATADYWDEDGYLIHMQFHRDEVRTIANFMSIGIGAEATAQELPPMDEALIPTQPVLDSAVLGEFVLGDGAAGEIVTIIEVPPCDTKSQHEPDNQVSTEA